jgi:hypothetical protein
LGHFHGNINVKPLYCLAWPETQELRNTVVLGFLLLPQRMDTRVLKTTLVCYVTIQEVRSPVWGSMN